MKSSSDIFWETSAQIELLRDLWSLFKVNLNRMIYPRNLCHVNSENIYQIKTSKIQNYMLSFEQRILPKKKKSSTSLVLSGIMHMTCLMTMLLLTQEVSAATSKDLEIATNMTTDVILASEENGSLTLGGKIELSQEKDAQEYATSAIAHYDASTDELIFAKSSSRANSISALALNSDNSQLLALAYNVDKNASLLLSMDLRSGNLVDAPVVIEGQATSLAALQSTTLILVPALDPSTIYQLESGVVSQLSSLTGFQAAMAPQSALVVLDGEDQQFYVAGSHDGQSSVFYHQNEYQQKFLPGSSFEENGYDQDDNQSALTHLFENKDQGILIAIKKKSNQSETMATFSVLSLDLSDDGQESELVSLFEEEAKELSSVHFAKETGVLHMLFSKENISQIIYVAVNTVDGSQIYRDEISSVSQQLLVRPLTFMPNKKSEEAPLFLLSQDTITNILENFQGDEGDVTVPVVAVRELTDEASHPRKLEYWNDPDQLGEQLHWVENWCSNNSNTGINCRTCQTSYPDLPSQEYTIGDEPLIFSVAGIDPIRCGYYYSYEITSSEGERAIVSFDDKTRTFKIWINDESFLRGFNSRTFRVTMIACGYYTVKSQFYLTIYAPKEEDPCTDPYNVQIISMPQTDPLPDAYTGQDIEFLYNAFRVRPYTCQPKVFVHCTSVTPSIPGLPCQELETYGTNYDFYGKLTWNFDQNDYLSGRVPPGDYIFTYCVGIEGLPETHWKVFTVKVTLLDPCNPPAKANFEDFEDQWYTIGEETVTYIHPALQIHPDYCSIQYHYDVPGLADGGSPIMRTQNRFDIFWDEDQRPVDESPLTVTITAKIFSPYAPYDPVKCVGTFDVIFKPNENPCLDPNFVMLLTPVLDPKQFTIGQNSQEQVFNHGAFDIVTKPIDSDICDYLLDGLVIEASFDQNTIGPGTDPLGYQDGTFTLFTQNMVFAGQTFPYGLRASLTGLPGVTASVTSTIEFKQSNTGCENPATAMIEATEQIDPLPDMYSGTTRLFELTPFTITPEACAGTESYECVAVAGPDNTSIIDFSDLCDSFDGTQLELVAVLDDYISGALPPGVYTFTIRGITQGGQVAFADFEWVLTSPCPESRCKVGEVDDDLVYTITDNGLEIYFPVVEIEPAFCANLANVEITFEVINGNEFTAQTISVNEQEGKVFIEEFDSLDPITFGDENDFSVERKYDVVFTVKIGNNSEQKTVERSSTLTYKNPCHDPDYVNWQFTDLPDDIRYTIGDSRQVKCCYNVELITKPRQHDLCGPLVEDPYFEGTLIEVGDMPLDRCDKPDCSDVYVETSDMKWVGDREWSVRAYLLNYQDVRGQIEEFAEVKFLEPCESIDMLKNLNDKIIELGDYAYTGNTVFEEFEFYQVKPEFCSVNYTCTVIQGNGLNQACNQPGTLVFDPISIQLMYQFDYTDYTTYTPGLYIVKIEGCTGQGTSERCLDFQVEWRLENLCQEGRIQVTLLPDQLNNITYRIGVDGNLQEQFVLADLYIAEPPVDCGMPILTFYDTNTGVDLVGNSDFQYINPTETTGAININYIDPIYVDEFRDQYNYSYRFLFRGATGVMADYSQQNNGANAFTLFINKDNIPNVCDPVQDGQVARIPKDCGRPNDANMAYTGDISWLRTDVRDINVNSGVTRMQTYNNGRCQGPPGSFDAKCELLNQKNSNFIYYRNNVLMVNGKDLKNNDDGFYVLTIQVSYRMPSFSAAATSRDVEIDENGRMVEKKSFVLTTLYMKYDDILFMTKYDFRGKIFQRWPLFRSRESVLKPYVRYVSPRGRVNIRFSQRIRAFTRGSLKLFRDRRSRRSAIRRRLSDERQQVQFLDENYQASEEVYEIFDVIEFTLTSSQSDDITPIRIEWSDLNLESDQEISLQMDLDSITNLDQYDRIEVSFNDASNMFESEDGTKGLDFGQQISWNIDQILVKNEEADILEIIGHVSLTLVVISVALSLLLIALSGCRLKNQFVGTWIFLCWLQLVAHLILVQGLLPASVRLMIQPILQGLRLKLIEVSGLHSDDLADSKDSYLQSSGYHTDFEANTFCILVILAILLILLAITRLTTRCRACNRNRFSNLLALVTMRFAFYFAFEFWLCTLICLNSSSYSPSTASIILSVGTLTLTALTAAYLLSLYCCNGPYLSDTYAEKSILGSYWGIRELHPDIVKEYLQSNSKMPEETPQKVEVEKKPVRFGQVKPIVVDDAARVKDNMTMTNQQTLTMADTMSGALQLRSAVARKVYYEKYEGGQEEAAGEIIEEIRPETDRAMSRMITETNFNDGRMVTERAFITEMGDEEELPPTRVGTTADQAVLKKPVERKASTQAKTRSRYEKQAKILMRLEGIVAKTAVGQSHGELFFLGLRLNTAHNTAITQPLLSLVTRFLAAIILFYMQDQPQLAILALMGLCLAQILFNVVEKPWKDSKITRLTCINEFMLYLILCFGLAASSASVAAKISMMSIISYGIAVNFFWSIYQSVRSAKLIYLRYLKRKSMNKVAIIQKDSQTSPSAAQKLKQKQATIAVKVEPADPYLQDQQIVEEIDVERNNGVKMTDGIQQPRLGIVGEEGMAQRGYYNDHFAIKERIGQVERATSVIVLSDIHQEVDQFDHQNMRANGSQHDCRNESMRMQNESMLRSMPCGLPVDATGSIVHANDDQINIDHQSQLIAMAEEEGGCSYGAHESMLDKPKLRNSSNLYLDEQFFGPVVGEEELAVGNRSQPRMREVETHVIQLEVEDESQIVEEIVLKPPQIRKQENKINLQDGSIKKIKRHSLPWAQTPLKVPAVSKGLEDKQQLGRTPNTATSGKQCCSSGGCNCSPNTQEMSPAMTSPEMQDVGAKKSKRREYQVDGFRLPNERDAEGYL